MNNTKIEECYYARIKNKNGNYIKIGREFENEILCVNRLQEWINENKLHDEEMGSLRYDYNSWEIIKEITEKNEILISSKVIHGNNEGWSLITEDEKEKIIYNKRGREKQNLNELIVEYNLTHFKFLSKHIWGLEYPLLDHFVLFRDLNEKEYLVSHTYLNEFEIENEMKLHNDLDYEILDGFFYGWYENKTTNFVIFSKKNK